MVPGPEAPEPLPTAAVLEIDKPGFGFAAAHFSILEGGAERLHGHNYRVRLRAHGDIGEQGSVVDFAVLKRALTAACDELDHRMLVPAQCAGLTVDETPDGLRLEWGERHYLFPRAEVALLPVVNTTCECLAGHVMRRLRDLLGALAVRLEVTVDESPGQGATVAEPSRTRG